MKFLYLALAVLAASPASAQHAPIVVLASDGSSSILEVNTRDKFGVGESITAPVFNESSGE
jgi:hypothetical protein